jgi:hypothetical protein
LSFEAEHGSEDAPNSIGRETGQTRETDDGAEQGSQEAHHSARGDDGRARTQYVELTEGCTPITTYPSDLPRELPWEGGNHQMTLERCRSHYEKLQNDLSTMDLPPESKQSLEIVLGSLQNFIQAYENLGPTTDGFVDLMRRRRDQVMGPDKWDVVKERVTREQAKSMFNFKEGLKKDMLKVQYFKHPHLAHLLYDRFLAAYGRFPWNDEVSQYFARFFYAEFFLNMKPDYTDVHSKFYGVGKGRIYDREGAHRDPATLRPPPQISRPPRLVALKSEMEPTSQLGTTARNFVGDGLSSVLVGVDVGLVRERARSAIRQKFVYKTDDEIDGMSIEDVRAYAKICRDLAANVISNDTSSLGEVR